METSTKGFLTVAGAYKRNFELSEYCRLMSRVGIHQLENILQIVLRSRQRDIAFREHPAACAEIYCVSWCKGARFSDVGEMVITSQPHNCETRIKWFKATFFRVNGFAVPLSVARRNLFL